MKAQTLFAAYLLTDEPSSRAIRLPYREQRRQLPFRQTLWAFMDGSCTTRRRAASKRSTAPITGYASRFDKSHTVNPGSDRLDNPAYPKSWNHSLAQRFLCYCTGLRNLAMISGVSLIQ